MLNLGCFLKLRLSSWEQRKGNRKQSFLLDSAVPLLNRVSSTPAVWPTVGSSGCWLQNLSTTRIFKLLFKNFEPVLSKSGWEVKRNPLTSSHTHICVQAPIPHIKGKLLEAASCPFQNCKNPWKWKSGLSTEEPCVNNRNWKSCASCCTF